MSESGGGAGSSRFKVRSSSSRDIFTFGGCALTLLRILFSLLSHTFDALRGFVSDAGILKSS